MLHGRVFVMDKNQLDRMATMYLGMNVCGYNHDTCNSQNCLQVIQTVQHISLVKENLFQDFFHHTSVYNMNSFGIDTLKVKPGTSCEHVRIMKTPLHPTFLYRKTGVYRGR